MPPTSRTSERNDRTDLDKLSLDDLRGLARGGPNRYDRSVERFQRRHHQLFGASS